MLRRIEDARQWSAIAPKRACGVARRAACGLLLALTTLATTPARAEEVAGCGASPTPEEVLRRINEIRALGRTCRAGQFSTGAPLRWSKRLASAAQYQSQQMALMHRMSHRDSRNGGLGERLRDHGYAYVAAAENVAVGYSSFEEVVQAWLDSEGHCENLMSDRAVESGLACTDGGGVGFGVEHRYWTMVFGTPAGR
jgi:uncharacterized protein YkwD